MKQKNKNRIKRNLAGKKIQCSMSKKHARGAKEPWLIASSISPREISAVNMMILYKKRMQIEEVFRDLKNMRNGFGLRHCRSFNAERLNIALIIGILGMLIFWLFGAIAEEKNLHYSFQSNSIKNRSVLSIFFIGYQVLNRRPNILTNMESWKALNYIVSMAVNEGHRV